MLETTNPEIDVQELMARVHAEVHRRRAAGALPDAPPTSLTDMLESRVAEAIREARQKHTVDARIPYALQRVFRDQGAVNIRLIHAAERLAEQVSVLRAGQKEQASEIAALKAEVAALKAEVAALRAEIASQRQTDLAAQQAGQRKLESEIATLKGETFVQWQSSLRLIDGLKLQPSGTAETAGAMRTPEVQQHSLDAFYLAFENRYRGSREEIKRRLSVYLPHVAQAGVGTAENPILDLGCGRGEWLELLKEKGFAARGVDMNAFAVAACGELGLDVVESDMIACLRSLPDRSIGMVTAFHIIEHLPWPLLLEMMSEVYRVLQEGGVVVLESPNPANVLVGACSFYLDPTHLRPLPNGLATFLVEHAGFTNIQTLFLQPFDLSARVGPADSPVAQRFNDFFFGPQDYAVIGDKPVAVRAGG